MTESEFLDLTHTVFDHIETTIETVKLDIDVLRSDNILQLELENGDKIIINRHVVNQELWVAAKTGAYHYHFRDKAWINTRTGSSFFDDLAPLICPQDTYVKF